ncbi:MAG TPA: transglutaminase-like domain-containing protein [Phycisphaerae bacterium]|nr:transglutaminase-like domain-containing protein [Phycisphaerae bacterium]
MIRPETTDVQQYLVSDDVIDWSAPSVSAKAQELTHGLQSEVEKARRLFEWVRDEIPHSKDINADVVACSASEVLRAGTGICFAKSHLLAALLRAIGIPAGFCYQVLMRDAPFKGFVLHGLNGVLLPTLGQWLRVDPRGNTGPINAQFGIEKEQLAFPTDTASGEFSYDTVFASPAREVVFTLRRFSNRTEMWPHLPQRLEGESVQ